MILRASPSDPEAQGANMASLVQATAEADALIRRHAQEDREAGDSPTLAGLGGEVQQGAAAAAARKERHAEEWHAASEQAKRATPAAIITTNREPWKQTEGDSRPHLFVGAMAVEAELLRPPFLRLSNESPEWWEPGVFLTRRQLQELCQWAVRVGFFAPEVGRAGEDLEECRIFETNGAHITEQTAALSEVNQGP